MHFAGRMNAQSILWRSQLAGRKNRNLNCDGNGGGQRRQVSIRLRRKMAQPGVLTLRASRYRRDRVAIAPAGGALRDVSVTGSNEYAEEPAGSYP
jgi:hypothetical protein